MTGPLPYGRQSLGPEEEDLVRQVLRSDRLTQGPMVAEFEQALTAACAVPHAVAVCNATMALYLACRAVGLGPGDRFITTPLTFAATANAGVLCGARPVFCDIDAETGNIDPALVAAALRDDPGIKAVIAVHLGGLVCDLEALHEAMAGSGAVLIEDACHALGGSWRDRSGDWRTVGACDRSLLTCFSFHPVKTVTTGEGGAVTTRDGDLAERLRRLASHGITRDPARMRGGEGPWSYEMQELGINARLADVLAAIGVAQMRKLDRWRERRLELVRRYDAALAGLPGLEVQRRPTPEDRTCWHLMMVRSDRRDGLYEHLQSQGILAQVHYIPVHLQPYYRDLLGTGPGDFSRAERFYAQALSLPLFPAMTDADCDRVIAAVRQFQSGSAGRS